MIDSAKPNEDASGLPWLMPPKTEWRGQWVWTSAALPQRNAYAYFRRPFETAGGMLTIEITADSFYWLYLDGVLLAQGPSRAHLEYYSFDTHTLKVAAGRHCLAVMGHHIGEVNATVMTGRAGVLADIILTEAERVQDFSTGIDWCCLTAEAWRRDLTCTMSHFGFWEDCDLRRVPEGWTQPGFSNAAWSPSVVVGIPPCPPWLRLCPRDIALPRYARLDPVCWVGAGHWWKGVDDAVPSKMVAARRREGTSVIGGLPLCASLTDDKGQFITADFSRTVSGYVELEFSQSEPGQCVELSYDDLVNMDGVVNPERSYAHLTDRFILPGGRCEIRTAHPRGFRYLMIDFSGVGTFKLDRLSAEEETYPFDMQSTFEGSDSALNNFYRKSAETVRICTTDAFTDCATRERVQWMEDLYMHSRVAAYVFGDTRMLRRALFQAAQNALPDGRINGFMPSERTNCAFASSSLMWLHTLVDYLLFSGDEDDMRRLMPTARRLLEFMNRQADGDGLLTWPSGQFWDWAPIEDTGCLLLTNAAYVWALERLGQHEIFREALGVEMGTRVCALRSAAQARFWDGARRLYRDAVPSEAMTPIYSQHANVMAILAGICPPPERVALLEQLVDPARLGPIPVGEQSLGKGARPTPEKIVPAGTLWFGHFLCQALFENGLADMALDQMRQLWGAFPDMLTFPETRIQNGNTFMCHGWAAGPAFLLPAFVLGVIPAGSGWSEIKVTPLAGGLNKAAGTIPTPHGPICVEWHNIHGRLKVSIKAPQGIRIHPSSHDADSDVSQTDKVRL